MGSIPLVFNVFDTEDNRYVLKNTSYEPIIELTGIGKSRIKTCCYTGELLKKRYRIERASGGNQDNEDKLSEEFIDDFCYKWDEIRLKINPKAKRR